MVSVLYWSYKAGKGPNDFSAGSAGAACALTHSANDACVFQALAVKTSVYSQLANLCMPHDNALLKTLLHVIKSVLSQAPADMQHYQTAWQNLVPSTGKSVSGKGRMSRQQ